MKQISINQTWCKACGICAALCPKKVFDCHPDGRILVQRPKDCIGCRLCEKRCPDFAIKVEEIKNG